MADVSLLFNFLKGRDDVGPALNEKGDQLLALGEKSNAAGMGMGAFANGGFLLGSALAVAIPEAIALTDALAPMTGLLAELPALGFAAAAGVGTLILGFHGLTAALQGAAAGSGVTAAQLISAQHSVTQAQQQATLATQNLAQARQQEMTADRNLALQLKQANLSLAEAQLGVRDAQKALTQAQLAGDPLQIAHAQLALQSAQLQVQSATNSLSDTQQQYNLRQQQGVGGSAQVQAALRAQADATYQVGAAQRSLAQTQAGSGAAAAALAYAKLAPSAKAVVDVFKALLPAWKDVQQATQQSLFAGASTDIRRLATEYLPVLRQQLPAIASGWGAAFHQTAQLAATPAFVRDLNTALAGTAGFIRNAGQALAPFVDGFMQFVAAGSGNLPKFGTWIHSIAVDFDHWATAARDSGKINKWITEGVTAARGFWGLLVNLTGALVGIFKAGSGGPQFLDNIVKGAVAFKAWVDSAKGQGQLQAMFTTLRGLFSDIWKIVPVLGVALVQLGPSLGSISPYLTVTGAVVKVLADNIGLIKPLLPVIIAGFVAWKVATIAGTVAQVAWKAAQAAGLVIMLLANQELVTYTIAQEGSRLAVLAATAAQWLWNAAMDANPIGLVILGVAALAAGIYLLWTHSAGFRNFFIGLWKDISNIDWKGIWSGMVGAFKWVVNGIIDALNFLIAHFDSGVISSINSIGHFFGVPSIPAIPQIPKLATGGTVTSSGLAIIHKGETVIPAGVAPLGSGGGAVHVTIEFASSGNKDFDTVMMTWLRKQIRVRGGKGANSVQRALGQ